LWLVGSCTTASVTPDDAGGDATLDAIADGKTDGAPCDLLFTAPGCDASPVCLQGPFDACAGVFCGCNGMTFSGGCGNATTPFESFGYCDGDTPDQNIPDTSGE